jgi:hypothetical protein
MIEIVKMMRVPHPVIMIQTRAGFSTNDDDDDRGTCREIGYSDGQNGDFDHGVYNDGCDDVYMNGFIDGCMDVEGNTLGVCQNAADA